MGYFIALFILLIIASLATAGFFMLRRPTDDLAAATANKPNAKRNMVRALTFRIGLSVVLFVCVLLAYQLGWIAPKPYPPECA
jgi:archaellum biogenesis protein FlaJ (TadC family)